MNASPTDFGFPVEICIATRCIDKTIQTLCELGVGPWRIYSFDESTVSDRRSYGEPDPFEIDVAFASKGPLIFEVMQPKKGAIALGRALSNEESVWHHVSFDDGSSTFPDRMKRLYELNALPILSGVQLDLVPFYFFVLPETPSVVLEIYDFPKAFKYPEPLRWYPEKIPDTA